MQLLRPARDAASLIAMLAGLWAPMTAWSPPAHAATTATTPATAASAASARVIVRFKAGATALRSQAQSVGATSETSAAATSSSRAAALGTRVGIALTGGHAIDDRTQVVFATNTTSQALAARLAQEADVEFAEPDRRRHRVTAAADPYYLAGPADRGTVGGPASGQWYLRAPTVATASASAVVSSINIETAWDAVSAAGNVVVAVLDSGVRFDHADLGGGSGTSPGGNFLPGYDFVSDATYSGDGDGRDADPSDPGDFITDAEANSAPFLPPVVDTACTPLDPSTGRHVAVNSEWHGTQTTGLIAALTDNNVGIAGVGRNHVKVLPLRVLAKCGGSDSDIVSAMLWAGGIAVPGVPANAHPARVISLSLGGDGACPSVYSSALAQLKAKGVMVVAAAGNGNADDKGTSVIAPANCPGVVAVAALRQAGSKVGFSNLGPQVAISAPGGNCINVTSGAACLYPIMSTTNAGTTVPVAGDSSYTDSYNAAVGTSYSTPLVAGTAALAMAANPALTADEVLARLKSSARPFVTTGATAGIASCADPATAADGVDECYCTTALCGAGMLDASAAVLAAVGGVQARIAVSPTAVQAGQTVTFDASGSLLASGRSIASYAWSVTDGGGVVTGFSTATNGASVAAVPSAAGTFTVAVTLTDDTGATSTASSTVTATAPPVVTPPPTTTTSTGSSGGGGGGGGAVGWTWLVLVPLAATAAVRRRNRPATAR